ncbi:unnamed protein product [Clonostachys rosea]|uniref:TauD/TfdA-like domain-containing protein n=1 Tax=Bionectria ochroleuca TaxID=29856 RepID=A0ABY6UG03_BIOOC|nr:unnamed protein product [Clonostachys rosea]
MADNVEKTLPTSDAGTETSSKILEIIFEFALNKVDDSVERLTAGTSKFLPTIDRFVKEGKRVELCLPAFPFKSANKVYKVFGILPDKGEELALERLNRMCERIRGVYKPGAKLTILSDGVVYNDLLSVPDRHVWQFGEALRAMATKKKFKNLGFARIKDVVKIDGLPEPLKEISYVANATNFRCALLNTYGKEGIDIDEEIANNPDTRLTFEGYQKFLEADLEHIYPTGEDLTSEEYKEDVSFLAKQMLTRGYAFARAIEAGFPNHLRLSIHKSTGDQKITMCLLDTKTGFTTPWHCSVAQMADGQWLSAPMGEFKKNSAMEIVEEEGRPMYFREKKV